MSNKTDLQALNAKYDSLIETLKGKAAGGSGGGSVETCTVTVRARLSSDGVSYICYTRLLDDGTIKSVCQTYDNSTEVILTNVVANTVIAVKYAAYRGVITQCLHKDTTNAIFHVCAIDNLVINNTNNFN